VKPFIDFYTSNKISPVHQDISDLGAHFDRREALYRHLGIPAGLVRGKSIIEFGPGTGQNSIYTASLEPSRYVLVDGNPTGLEETTENLSRYCPGVEFDLVGSLVEEFGTEETFDIVLCEGVIPFQIDPGGFARHVGKFVSPGGILVITCIDGISFMGETTRRLVADKLIDFSAPTEQRLEALRPVFQPHLATLKGMTRLVDDWLYDNILVPYSGSLFSVENAIAALASEFDVYASSPHFLTDWRWYKQVHGDDRRYNEHGIKLYHQNVLNLIDYRVDIPAQPVDVGQSVLARATQLFETMKAMANANESAAFVDAAVPLREIGQRVKGLSPLTAKALFEVADFLTDPVSAPSPEFDAFTSFFGRGQQYLSFTRRA